MKLAIGVLSVVLAIAPLPAAADHDHPHGTGAGDHDHAHDKLGTVRFATSCQAETQATFLRGLAFLHSFGYAPAIEAFREVAKADPDCAMAEWGIAMTYFHSIWAPPTPEDLAAGGAAATRATRLAAGEKTTPRERAFVGAIATFYRDADKLDHRTRVKAYSDAMAAIAKADPQDEEAAIFHALSLLSIAYNAPPDKNYPLQKQAAQILNPLLATYPDHPGITHYMIHSFDYPELAELALPAARTYAKIAPDSPHALHMPSHIFTRLGLWEESIASNLASEAAANRGLGEKAGEVTSYNALHAEDYLAYAYLQRCQDGKVAELAGRVGAIRDLDATEFSAGHAIAAIPARQALERHRWSEAASLPSPSDAYPWQKLPYGEAITHFARAIGAARSGNVETARTEVARLAEIQKSLLGGKGFDWATQVEIQRLAAAGWLAQAEKRSDEARQLLKAAANLEDQTDKHPVTPGAVLPARELLADLEMEQGDAAAALADYQATLRVSPGRVNALLGAAAASEKLGKQAEAKAFRGQLATLCAAGDGERAAMITGKVATK